MPLKLLPLPQSEWHMYFRICWAAFVPGLMGLMYPNGLTETTIPHAVESLKRADSRYPGRINFFKVVDTDLPASDPFSGVVGVSQWRIYPRERTEEEMKQEGEISDQEEQEFGLTPGLSEEVVEDFGGATNEYKKKHLGGSPFVLLQVLATRPEHERRGVGALSLNWGTKKADEMGLPAYLESSPKGVALYRKWGFEVVDTLPWDARKYGYHESLTHLCMKRPATELGQE